MESSWTVSRRERAAVDTQVSEARPGAPALEGSYETWGTRQLTDFMGAAKDAGAKFSLYLGEKTELTKPLAKHTRVVRQCIAQPEINL